MPTNYSDCKTTMYVCISVLDKLKCEVMWVLRVNKINYTCDFCHYELHQDLKPYLTLHPPYS